MNRVQKMAWLILGSIVAAFVLSIAATLIFYLKVGLPRAFAGFGFLGIAGIGGLGPLLFKKEKGSIASDERDGLIGRRAALAGFATAYLILCLATMIPWFILGPKAAISVNWLPGICIAAGFAHYAVWSIAILAQYGRRNRNYE